MENIATILLPLVLLLPLFRLVVLSARRILSLTLYFGSGFACLWILNTLSGLTGISLPVNAVTVALAGFGGLPGIGLVALLSLT